MSISYPNDIKRFVELLITLENEKPSKQIIDFLFDSIIGCNFSMKRKKQTIKQPSLIEAIIILFKECDLSLKTYIIKQLIILVSMNTINCDICCKYNLLSKMIKILPSIESHTLFNLIIKLIVILGCHNISTNDIEMILSCIQLFYIKGDENKFKILMKSIIDMDKSFIYDIKSLYNNNNNNNNDNESSSLISINEPKSYFMFDGSKKCSLMIPSFDLSDNGYVLSFKIRVEYLNLNSNEQRILSLFNDQGEGYIFFITPYNDKELKKSSDSIGNSSNIGYYICVSYYSKTSNNVYNYKFENYPFRKNQWYNISISHVPKIFRRSEMKLFIDGHYNESKNIQYLDSNGRKITKCSFGSDNTISFSNIKRERTIYGQIEYIYLCNESLSNDKIKEMNEYLNDNDFKTLIKDIGKSSLFFYHPKLSNESFCFNMIEGNGLVSLIIGSLRIIKTMNVKESLYCSGGINQFFPFIYFNHPKLKEERVLYSDGNEYQNNYHQKYKEINNNNNNNNGYIYTFPYILRLFNFIIYNDQSNQYQCIETKVIDQFITIINEYIDDLSYIYEDVLKEYEILSLIIHSSLLKIKDSSLSSSKKSKRRRKSRLRSSSSIIPIVQYDLWINIYKKIILNYYIWIKDDDILIKYFDFLIQCIERDKVIFRDYIGIEYFIKLLNDELSYGRKVYKDNDYNNIKLKKIRSYVFKMISMITDDEFNQNEMKILLSYMYDNHYEGKDSIYDKDLIELMDLMINLLKKNRKKNYNSLQSIGRDSDIFFNLIDHENEIIRVKVINILSFLMNNNMNSSSKDHFIDYSLCPMIKSMIKNFKFTKLTYKTIINIIYEENNDDDNDNYDGIIKMMNDDKKIIRNKSMVEILFDLLEYTNNDNDLRKDMIDHLFLMFIKRGGDINGGISLMNQNNNDISLFLFKNRIKWLKSFSIVLIESYMNQRNINNDIIESLLFLIGEISYLLLLTNKEGWRVINDINILMIHYFIKYNNNDDKNEKDIKNYHRYILIYIYRYVINKIRNDMMLLLNKNDEMKGQFASYAASSSIWENISPLYSLFEDFILLDNYYDDIDKNNDDNNSNNDRVLLSSLLYDHKRIIDNNHFDLIFLFIDIIDILLRTPYIEWIMKVDMKKLFFKEKNRFIFILIEFMIILFIEGQYIYNNNNNNNNNDNKDDNNKDFNKIEDEMVHLFDYLIGNNNQLRNYLYNRKIKFISSRIEEKKKFFEDNMNRFIFLLNEFDKQYKTLIYQYQKNIQNILQNPLSFGYQMIQQQQQQFNQNQLSSSPPSNDDFYNEFIISNDLIPSNDVLSLCMDKLIHIYKESIIHNDGMDYFILKGIKSIIQLCFLSKNNNNDQSSSSIQSSNSNSSKHIKIFINELKNDYIQNHKPDLDENTFIHNDINDSDILNFILFIIDRFNKDNSFISSYRSNMNHYSLKMIYSNMIKLRNNYLNQYNHINNKKDKDMKLRIQLLQNSYRKLYHKIIMNHLKDKMNEEKNYFNEKKMNHKIFKRNRRQLNNINGSWRDLLIRKRKSPKGSFFIKLDKSEQKNRIRKKIKINYHGNDHMKSSFSYVRNKRREEESLRIRIESIMNEIKDNDNDDITSSSNISNSDNDDKSSIISIDNEISNLMDGFDDSDFEMIQSKNSSINNNDLKSLKIDDNDILFSSKCELIMPELCVYGNIEITKDMIYFYYDRNRYYQSISNDKSPNQKNNKIEDNNNNNDSSYNSLIYNFFSSKIKDRSWSIHDILSIYSRRYLLNWTALEIFFINNRSFFFNLPKDMNLKMFNIILNNKPSHLKDSFYGHSSELFKKRSDYTEKWKRREISNFDYIMKLNEIAGRTYNDLTQYPVFPWILSNYTSNEIDLSDPNNFRDLSKPIGALDKNRLNHFIERYESLRLLDDESTPPFHYGSHYSTPGSVLFYLIRLEPFTSQLICLQGGQFDFPDRQFFSISESWNNCLKGSSDVKELIPEFFYLPDFLKNMNGLDLGSRSDLNEVIDDVILPPWASSPDEFIKIHRDALESEYVSQNIHHWIDLIFGYKQTGVHAVESYNTFYYLTYEGAIDVDQLWNPVMKQSIVSQIENFGQTPPQLLNYPHPQRDPPKDNSALLLYSSSMIQQSFFSHTIQGKKQLPYSSPFFLFHSTYSFKSQFNNIYNDKIITLNYFGEYLIHKYEIKYHPRDGDIPLSFDMDSNYSTSSSLSSLSFKSVNDVQRLRLLENISSRMKSGNRRVSFLDFNHYIDNYHLMKRFYVLNDDSNTVISYGHWDGSIHLSKFDEIKGNSNLLKSYQILSFHKDRVNCVDLSHNYLIIGSEDTTASLWKCLYNNKKKKDGFIVKRYLYTISCHYYPINLVSISKEWGIIVTCSIDGLLAIHDLNPEYNETRSLLKHKSKITILKISNDGDIIAYCQDTHTIYRYTINGDLASIKNLHNDDCDIITQIIISKNCKYIITAHGNKVILRNLFNFDIIYEYQDVHSKVVDLILSGDERVLFVALEDGSIVFYFKPDGSKLLL